MADTTETQAATLARIYRERGQPGAAERFQTQANQEEERRRQLNPTPGFITDIRNTFTQDRQVIAAQLRAQSQYAKEALKTEKDRDDRRRYERIASRSTQAADNIERGTGTLSNAERLAIANARYPDSKTTELRSRYATGELQEKAKTALRNRKEAQAAGFENASAQRAAEQATQRQAAVDQRNAFVAGGKQIPGAFGRYVREERGYNPSVSSQQATAATQQLLAQGKASVTDPLTGRAYRTQPGGVLVATRNAPQAQRLEEARKAAIEGRADFQDTKGNLYQVRTQPAPQAEETATRGTVEFTTPSESKRRKVVFKETAIAGPVRKAGSYLAASSQAYFESPGPTAQKIQNTPYLGATVDTIARGFFQLGVKLEEKPDETVGKIVLIAGASKFAGKVAGSITSEIGLVSPVAAVRTEGVLRYVGLGVAAEETIKDPAGAIANAPEIIAGATGFAKGYKAANPAPVVELGEPRFQSTGSLVSGKKSTVLGQYAEGETPTKVTQFGKTTESTSPTRAFITGSNQATEAALKSSVTTLTTVTIPGRGSQEILQQGNLISADVQGRQFQLLATKDQPARLLFFEEKPLVSVTTGNPGAIKGGGTGQPPIASRTTLIRTLSVDDASAEVLTTRSGATRVDLIETAPGTYQSPKTALVIPKGVQTEFATDVLPGPALRSSGVKQSDIVAALDIGRREGILPEYQNDIVYGYDVLVGKGGIGKKGQFSFTRPEIEPPKRSPSEVTFDPFRDIPQALPTSTQQLSSRPVVVFLNPSASDVSSKLKQSGSPVSETDPRTINRPVQELIPVQIPEQLPTVVPSQIPRQIPRQVTRQIPQQIPQQIPEQIPQQIPRQIVQTLPRIVTTVKPPITPLFPLQPREQKIGEPLFDVEIRRRGQFRTFSTQGLRLEDAVKLGESIVDTTAAASFKIVERGSGLPISGDTKARAERLLPAGKYRPSKKDDNIFVEKSRFRINTIGEKGEIRPTRGVFGETGKSPFGRSVRV